MRLQIQIDFDIRRYKNSESSSQTTVVNYHSYF